MKNLLILILLSLTLQNTQAQQPITFERAYSDSGVFEGRRIRQTFDAGYIVAGRRNANATFFGDDGILMKTDSLGNVEWVKVYGTTLSDDQLNDVEQTADSGFIACGNYPEIGEMDNVYIIKTDKNGDTLWTKVYATNLTDRARSIVQTYDGGYATTGIWQDSMGFVFRLDAQGDTLWTKYIYIQPGISMYSIAQTADSGFVATGVSYDTILALQTYIIRLDKYGNTLWQKNYGYGNTEEGRSIKVLPDGSFLVGGYSWQPPNHYDSYLLKLDTSGDTLWTRLFSLPNENGIVELATTSLGDIIFGESHYTTTDNYQSNITKTDSMGNLLWRREYGGAGEEYINGITICRDGGFALCAFSNSYGLRSEMYLVKTNANGLLTALIELEDQKTVAIKVGPNPFEGKLYVDLTELLDKDYQIFLYDIWGHQLITETMRGGVTTLLPIDSSLPPATYFLQIQDKGKTLIAIPVIHY